MDLASKLKPNENYINYCNNILMRVESCKFNLSDNIKLINALKENYFLYYQLETKLKNNKETCIIQNKKIVKEFMRGRASHE